MRTPVLSRVRIRRFQQKTENIFPHVFRKCPWKETYGNAGLPEGGAGQECLRNGHSRKIMARPDSPKRLYRRETGTKKLERFSVRPREQHAGSFPAATGPGSHTKTREPGTEEKKTGYFCFLFRADRTFLTSSRFSLAKASSGA